LGYKRRALGSSRGWAKARLREKYGNKNEKLYKIHEGWGEEINKEMIRVDFCGCCS